MKKLVNETFKAVQKFGHKLPGYENVKAAKEKYATGDYTGAAKETGKSLAKAAGTGLAVAAGLGAAKTVAVPAAVAAGKYIKDKLTGGQEKTGGTVQNQDAYKQVKRNVSKTKSGFGREPKTTDATYQARLKQKSLTSENTIKTLKKMMAENISSQEVTINGRTLEITHNMAKMIMEVYNSLNNSNKKKIETMLNESVDSFKKILQFSIKQ